MPEPTPPIVRTAFGKVEDGRAVELFTLTNRSGASASVMTRGAALTRLRVPDREGTLGDVALGFDEVGPYEGAAYATRMGASVGRVINRIARGRFTLDGRRYQIPVNAPPNSIHGGPDGFDRRIWTATPHVTGEGVALTLGLRDPAGANGYPGRMEVRVTYTLTHRNALRIETRATTTAPTPFNPSNHAYFNLRDGGATDIGGHVLRILADRYAVVGRLLVPTGVIAPVAGTPIDFRRSKPIGRDLLAMGGDPPGYDQNLVLRGIDRFGHRRFGLAAIVEEPETGRRMEAWTDRPGLQLYTGNSLDGTIGRGGAVYASHHGLCLEAQGFPDAPNHPNFPSVILRSGEVYRQRTEYRFGLTDR